MVSAGDEASGGAGAGSHGPVVLVDLDGVIWRGEEAIPGGGEAVKRLRAAGARVAFFTNNSFAVLADQLAKLRRMGVEVEAEDLLTSAQAAAQLVEPGESVLALGGGGVLEALAERGVTVTPVGELSARLGVAPSQGTDGLAAGASAVLGSLDALVSLELPSLDAVVAGIDPVFDYRRLALAARAVRGGARLVGTNSDATFPTPGGVVPGAGAVLAALAVAAGVEPEVAGKPNEAAARLARRRLGAVSWVVGDRPETDGAFAERLGAGFALVLSGVTPPGHGPLTPPPAIEAADLAELVSSLLEDGELRPAPAARAATAP